MPVEHPSFTAVFVPAEEGGYVVEFPQLPGCVSEGDTFEEAMANAREALAGWLAAAEASGWPVPLGAEPVVARVAV
jgi:predicted RNase H-like HicB family nuclease